jgi:hypothetical protein
MRFQVEVRRENEDPLRGMAFAEHRSVREHASYLLNLKIQEELARLKIGLSSTDERIAEVA